MKVAAYPTQFLIAREFRTSQTWQSRRFCPQANRGGLLTASPTIETEGMVYQPCQLPQRLCSRQAKPRKSARLASRLSFAVLTTERLRVSGFPAAVFAAFRGTNC